MESEPQFYAVDPVSGRALPVCVEGKELVGLFGPASLSAEILVRVEWPAACEGLGRMGYHNVRSYWAWREEQEEAEKSRRRSEQAKRAALARWGKRGKKVRASR